MQAPDLDALEHDLDLGFYLRVEPWVDGLAASADPRARLLAGRALRQLGADRRAEALVQRTGRAFPGHAEAVVALWRSVLSERGAYLAQRVQRRFPLPADAGDPVRAEALSVQMRAAAQLRDFERMHALRAQVRRLDDTAPWPWMEWAYCCLDEDRPEAAAEAAAQALALCPGFRAARHLQASLALLQGRPAEARARLEAALADSECAAYGRDLLPLLEEAGDLDAIPPLLDRIEALTPRAERRHRDWLAARRADHALRAGRLPEAAAAARRVGAGRFYAALADRIGAALAAGQAADRRVVLPVPFVRQHWLTCAPATLSALSAHWGRPVDHLEVVEAVCYDGTPWVSERRWAVAQGWQVHEFTVDWPTTVALLDAGLPFTVTTTEVASAHLQAMIGYDALRATLLVRDPTEPAPVEYDAEAFFRRYRADGPRGMLLLPPDQAGRLAGIELPDAAAWDGYHRVQAALTDHDRNAAEAAAAALEASHPGHHRQLHAARSLALYDGHETQILACTERLLALSPDDGHLALSKATSLRAIGGPEAHLGWLRACAARPDAHPLMRVRLGERLSEDERCAPEARALARQALRGAPGLAVAWTLRADLAWQAGERDEALEAYRAAACLRDLDEAAAETYARACRFVGEAEAGLDHLRRRVERLGGRSGAPARTLFEALEAQDRMAEAFEVLAQAQQRRPDDAELALFGIEALLRHGQPDAARAAWTALPEAGVSTVARLRVQSRLAEAEDRFDDALVAARAAAEAAPLQMDLRRLVARQLERLQGREAAIAEQQRVVARFPHHIGQQRLLYDLLPRDDPRELPQLLCLAALQPADAWALREQAVLLARARRFDEAEARAREALALAPLHSSSHGVLGRVLLERDGYDAARPHLEQALKLDADNDSVLHDLLAGAPDAERARSALALVAQALATQPMQGDAVLPYQAWASDHLPRAELLEGLRALAAARPRLWPPQVALARVLAGGDADEAEAALALLEEAARRFPMVARIGLERAVVLRQRDRRAEAREAMRAVLAISPAWNRAVRLQVDLIAETDDDWPEAERLLRRALALAPADADLRAVLGWVLEQAGRPADALPVLQAALVQDAEPEWIWKTVERCAEALGEPRRVAELLAAVEGARPADPWPRIVRARLAREPAEALAAAEEALQRDPRLVAAWHERLSRMLELGQHDALRELCERLPWPDGGPAALRLYGPRAQRAAGDKPGATQALRALLAREPSAYALWQQLADWHDDDGEHDDYLAAAQQMLRLDPQHVPSQVYVGHALVKAGRPAEALAPLARALELSPAHGFAAQQLARAAMDTGQPARADAALEAHWAHRQDFGVAAAGVRAALKQGDTARITVWFERALAVDRYEQAGCVELLDELREAGHGALLEPLQRAALERGQCALGAAIDWLQGLKQRRGRVAALDEVDAMVARSGDGTALAAAAVRWLVRDADAAGLTHVTGRWRALLQADEALRGDVSWAWLQFDRPDEVVAWLADWRTRGETPTWVLTNLCIGLGSLGRFDEAGEVAARALERSPFDLDAELWRALALAVRGEGAALREATERLERQPLEDWMKPLVQLLRATLLWRQRQDRAGAGRLLREARRAGREAPAARHFSAWLMLELWGARVPRWLAGPLQRWLAR